MGLHRINDGIHDIPVPGARLSQLLHGLPDLPVVTSVLDPMGLLDLQLFQRVVDFKNIHREPLFRDVFVHPDHGLLVFIDLSLVGVNYGVA